MPSMSIIVKAEWDNDAEVWVASTTDIDGLATEAPTLEALREKVAVMVVELIELNGLDSSLPDIPIHIMAHQLTTVPNPKLRR